jgi:hypothetical protein
MEESAQEKIPPNGIEAEREKLGEFQRRCAEGLRRQREAGLLEGERDGEAQAATER